VHILTKKFLTTCWLLKVICDLIWDWNCGDLILYFWDLRSWSVYNNQIVNLATGVAYVYGRGRRRRVRTDNVRTPAAGAGEGRGGGHGVWLTVGGQATIDRSEIVACFADLLREIGDLMHKTIGYTCSIYVLSVHQLRMLSWDLVLYCWHTAAEVFILWMNVGSVSLAFFCWKCRYLSA